MKFAFAAQCFAATCDVREANPGCPVSCSQTEKRERCVGKDRKSKKELAILVADAIEAAIGASRVMPPFIEAHIRDGMGRT